MSSGFISETEIEKKRKQRQEEWERVRKPDEPLQAPEEPAIDNRSLYDRLKEQKDKKQEEFEEAHKLKNLVKVLDDDEVDFLDFVDRHRLEEERRKRTEEAQALSSFRSEVSNLREEMLQKHILAEIGLTPTAAKPKPKKEELSIGIGTSKTSQTKLLAGIVKRKHSSSVNEKEQGLEPESKVSKIDVKEERADASNNDSSTSSSSSSSDDNNKSSSEPQIKGVPYKGNLVCIGVLPGLSNYSNSSDSDEDILASVDKDSSDSDEEPSPTRDLCGRRIVEVDKDK